MHITFLIMSFHHFVAVVIEVYKKFKRLHRDVSAGNVMIKETGRGVMNDWDHSTVEEIREILLSFRTVSRSYGLLWAL